MLQGDAGQFPIHAAVWSQQWRGQKGILHGQVLNKGGEISHCFEMFLPFITLKPPQFPGKLIKAQEKFRSRYPRLKTRRIGCISVGKGLGEKRQHFSR